MVAIRSLLPCIALAVRSILASAASQPQVRLDAGTVYGGLCSDTGVQLYQGIPYAKPPIKNLRFMPPQPLEGKFPGGHLNATTPPAACIQFDPSGTGAPPSEDCLYVDIYVPAKSTTQNKPWPVKVFSYGGSNVFGDIAYQLYNGCHLATDAIVVTLNYRLGPLGFMALADAGIKGNMGLKDHIAALEWVQANIGAFGGDKGKVMLFGQSAGADNSFVISALPQAKSLIAGAVLQSGGGQEMTSLKDAQRAAASYVGVIDCKTDDLNCLQSKPVQELIDAYAKTPAFQTNSPLSGIFHVSFPNTTNIQTAILDGDFIKEEPLKTGAVVPIIAGSTEDESSFFLVPYYEAIGVIGNLTETNYTDYISLWGPYANEILAKYPFSMFHTSEWTESEAAVRGIVHLATTVSFTCPAQKALEAARNNGVAAYSYRFGVTPSCPWILVGSAEVPNAYARHLSGATHTSDVPFVFANMDKQPWGRGTCSYSQNEKNISRVMVAAWTGMAASGHPSTCLQKWPVYDVCERMGLHMEDGTPIEKLDFDECEFWNPIWEKIGGYKMPAKNCADS